jgi:tetratricopeptide (TPR) repeat protein
MVHKIKSYHFVWLRYIGGLILLLFGYSMMEAQSREIDSLKIEIAKDLPDTIRYYNLLALYEELYFDDVEVARAYLEEAIGLSKKIPDQYFYFNAYLTKCRDLIQVDLGIDTIVPMLQEALQLAKSIEYTYGEAAVMYELGVVYENVNQQDKAFMYYKSGLEMTEQINLPEDAVWYYNALGNLVHGRGDREEAFYYYQRGAEVAKQIQDNDWLTLYLNNIAEVYREKEDLERAVLYYREALKASVSQWDSCLIFSNFGQLYTADGQFELAENNLAKALDLALRYEIKEELGNIYLRWGGYYAAQGDFDQAFEQYKRVESLSKELADEIPPLYIQYYEMEILKCKAITYEAAGMPKQALTYQKQYDLYQDSIFTSEKRSYILNLDADYRIEQKRIQNQLLKAQSRMDNTRIQLTIILTIGLVIIAFLTFWLLYTLYRHNLESKKYAAKLEAEVVERTKDIRAINVMLEKSNTELESFASITSHDLKEPLRTIAGFSSFLESNLKQGNYDNMTTPIRFIKTNVKRMFTLVEDILAYSQIDENMERKLVPVAEVLDHVKENIQALALESSAELTYDLGKLTPDNSYKTIRLFHTKSVNLC